MGNYMHMFSRRDVFSARIGHPKIACHLDQALPKYCLEFHLVVLACFRMSPCCFTVGIKMVPLLVLAASNSRAVGEDACLSSIRVIDNFLTDNEAQTMLTDDKVP